MVILRTTVFAWFLSLSAVLGAAQTDRVSRALSKTDMVSYTGCYQLTLGRWWPWGFGEDAKFVTPPNRIELSPTLGTWGFENGEFLIRAIPAASTQESNGGGRPRASFWEVQPSNRVNLYWTDGLTGVTLNLAKQGNKLTGWAHPHFDAVPLIPRIASVKAETIPCR